MAWAELIASLSEGEENEIEAAWAIEIEKRIAEIEQGKVETVSWEEARDRIRASLVKS